MKRIALFSIVTIAALFSSACEKFPTTQLPEHYQHKLHASDAHPAKGHAPEPPKH